MTIDTTTPSTEGTEAAVPLTVEQPPITALQPDPVNPRPIGAEEWAELLRGIGIALESRIAVAVAMIGISLLQYIEACSSRNRSPEPLRGHRGKHTPSACPGLHDRQMVRQGLSPHFYAGRGGPRAASISARGAR